MSRHLTCGICSGLEDYERAIQHVQGEEGDTELSEAARRLVGKSTTPGPPVLLRCPECATCYRFESTYEFLIGFGGSYDEQTLTRLTDEEAAEYTVE